MTLAATFTRWPARLTLALFAILFAWSVGIGMQPVRPNGPPPPERVLDKTLYKAIATRVAAGESYYVAAPAEQRARGFPVKPVFTVRPPFLAWLTAAVGGLGAMGVLMQIVAIACIVALALRFLKQPPDTLAAYVAIAITAVGVLTLASPDLALLHDLWAGLLAAIAIALWRPGRWWPSVVIGFAAAITRDLAVPLLVAMAGAALWEGRRREAAIWAGATLLAVAVLALHWHQVAAVTLPGDPQSAGWVRAGGWPWIIHMYTHTNLLLLLPIWIAAPLVPVALIGWLGTEQSLALRAGLWIYGMTIMFAVIGRPDNLYWGGLLAPLIPPGIAFAPTALRQLWRTGIRGA